MSDRIEPTERTRLHRERHKARYERAVINEILDAAPFVHVGFVETDGQPFVLPTLHVRSGDKLWLHGSSAGRMARHIGSGEPICVTATMMDGIVLARSAFGHSMNFRSVVVLARGTPVTDPGKKLEVLRAVTEKVIPGRWDDVRHPTGQELKATAVVELPIDEASAKVRTGPPGDGEEERESSSWGGVIPLRTVAGDPLPDEWSQDAPLPRYLEDHLKEARPGP